ncbi:MAG: carboxypeptidase-like regulatory domain-containing protein [Flavobacteriales bacterium]
MYRITLLLLTCFLGFSAVAQKGTIAGTITSNENGKIEPMPFVNVVIKGTTNGASTDLDGKFSFSADPGTHIVLVSFVGYEQSEQSVTVTEGGTTHVDFELKGQGIDLGEVEVVTVVNREREAVLLMERKESTDLVQNIGAQELKKKGATDVAEGVQKMVGLSTVGGKYVVVRGLGDRYNAAYLNGLPLPSPDPDTKVAPLDIFPTSVVGSINVTKGFTPELYGDFSGGAVDIRTKRATGENILQVSLGGGMNTQTTFRDFTTYNGGGKDFWGRDDGTRAVPAGVLGQGATINGEKLKFPTNFNPTTRTASPDVNFGLFGGTSVSLGAETKLNFLATANYRNENRYRKGSVRVINTANEALIDYKQESWQFNTQTSALAALSLDLGKNHTIGVTSTWVNLSSDDVRLSYGEHFDYEDDVYARRFTYRQNTMWINQVAGEHRFGRSDRLKIDWAGAMSTADAVEPDRRQLVYLYPPGTENETENFQFNAIDRLENQRWYSSLSEEETSARAGLTYRILQKETADGMQPILLVRTGAQMKRKTRSFGYDIFSYDVGGVNAANPSGIDADLPDSYLNNTTYQEGLFSIRNVTGPEADHYIRQDINAAYLSAEYDVVPGKVKLLGGARLEDADQLIVYREQSDSYLQPRRAARILSTDVLPFAGVKIDLNEQNILRANASKTISRPGFREMAPFEYTEYFAGVKNVGNPNLQNGQIYNADLRFERYPNVGELLAVGVFGKQLIDPIEKVALATASGQLQSFRNTGTANVLGIELELVKNIGGLLGTDSTFWNDLSLGLNTTFLYSQITIDGALDDGQGPSTVLTNSSRPLQGASPYLLNADVSYGRKISDKVNGTLTLAYNVFGRRVFSAGANGLGDQYELPVGMLNAIARADIGKRWQANLTVRNVLDARVRIEQETPNGTSLINDYRTGANISMGLTYTIL